MGQKPSVTCIIVSYNSAATIGRCLQALADQRYAGRLEVIVYDNCSSDDTLQIVRAEFPQVRLVAGQENLGFAGGNNAAAAQAETDYLAFVNPDAFVDADWLDPLIDLLETDAGVGCASPAILIDGQARLNALGNRVHFSGMAYCQAFGQPPPQGQPQQVGAISGAAFVISRGLFERLGGFADSFFMYYEDTDLSLRIWQAGYACAVVPGARVAHAYASRFHPNKIFYLERNRFLSLFSTLSLPLLVSMAPAMLMVELMTWAYALLKGRAALAAKVRAWRDVRARRDWIAARRRATKPAGGKRIASLFSAALSIDYIDSTVLTKLVALAGWLSAAPTLALYRLLAGGEEPSEG